MNVQIVIRNYEDPEYRKEVGKPMSEHDAEAVVRGIKINLDHEHYYVDEEETDE